MHSVLVSQLLRISCMFTLMNIVVLFWAVWFPCLRGFALANTLLVLAITSTIGLTENDKCQKVFHSFGLEKEDMALMHYFTHVLPLLLVFKWGNHLDLKQIVLALISFGAYIAIVDIKWVYGLEVRQLRDHLWHIMGVYIITCILVFAAMFDDRFTGLTLAIVLLIVSGSMLHHLKQSTFSWTACAPRF